MRKLRKYNQWVWSVFEYLISHKEFGRKESQCAYEEKKIQNVTNKTVYKTAAREVTETKPKS
jgi:hypothetical protein